MAVNNDFVMEDDDFFLDTLNSTAESDLTDAASSTKVPQSTILNSNASAKFKIGTSSNTPMKTTPKLDLVSKGRFVWEEKNGINTLFIDCTPKVKKRKFPGPAGMFTQETGTENESTMNTENCEQTTTEKTQNLSNSQAPGDERMPTSWIKLRSALASTSSHLFSVAKYHNIGKILHDTSKMKLPKHVVIPLLCVFVKKFNSDEPHSVFADDTGEINGKIDREVLDRFKDSFKDGISLVLQKVTFLCNVLMLRKPSIVAIYFDDGSVKQIQRISLTYTVDDIVESESVQSPFPPELFLKHRKTQEANPTASFWFERGIDPRTSSSENGASPNTKPADFSGSSTFFNNWFFNNSKDSTALPESKSADISRASVTTPDCKNSEASTSTAVANVCGTSSLGNASTSTVVANVGGTSSLGNASTSTAVANVGGTSSFGGASSSAFQVEISTASSIIPEIPPTEVAKTTYSECDKSSNSLVSGVPNKLKTLPFLRKSSQVAVDQEDKNATCNQKTEISSPKQKNVIVEEEFEKDDFDDLLLNLDESSYMDA